MGCLLILWTLTLISFKHPLFLSSAFESHFTAKLFLLNKTKALYSLVAYMYIVHSDINDSFMFTLKSSNDQQNRTYILYDHVSIVKCDSMLREYHTIFHF